jgi:hypothetical protein
VRYSVTAEIAGRRFEQFPVDAALSEHPTAPSERLRIPSLLDFADIQPTEMPVIALEQHIAEKVHAYTATYGPQEQPSTRTKDLIDLLLIADLATPNADHLRDSLDATFRNRARQPLPSAFPAPPVSWATPYASAAEAVGLPTDLDTAHTDAATFRHRLLEPHTEALDRLINRSASKPLAVAPLANSPLETLIPKMYRRKLRRRRRFWWIEDTNRHVLGTEDQIPGRSVGRFDHALQGAYLRMALAAVSVVGVSFRH